MDNALIWLHVAGNLVWIGSILAVAVILTSKAGDPKTRGALGVRVYRGLASPAFAVSFVFGLGRLVQNVPYYLKQHHWMHGKLVFALAVIGLHHVIGARAKKLEAGTTDSAGPVGNLASVLLVSAIAAAAFAVLKLPD
jgi:putative membrane protein